MAQRPNDWDPHAAEVLTAPREVFDRMRETCPVAYADWRGWMVFRYDDVVAVSRDIETFSSAENWSELHPDLRAMPLRLDQPEHTLIRNVLIPIFRPERIRDFEPKSRAICAEMLRGLVADGSADFVPAFSNPFPARSLCAFLGWPVEDAAQIKQWSEALVKARFARDIDTYHQVIRGWGDYIEEAFETNRRQPGENVSAWLLQQEAGGRPLNKVELASVMRLLLQAGHGTTTAATGICIAYLARNPDAQDMLRAEPAKIPKAIEEMLRFDNPLVQMPRKATKDVEFGGRQILAGEEVDMNYVAANRDPRAFPDPDKCILDRTPNRHLVFGTGIHTCIGAPLARMEIRIAIEELLKATRRFSIAPDQEPERITYIRNEYVKLPLVFEPATG